MDWRFEATRGRKVERIAKEEKQFELNGDEIRMEKWEIQNCMMTTAFAQEKRNESRAYYKNKIVFLLCFTFYITKRATILIHTSIRFSRASPRRRWARSNRPRTSRSYAL